MSVRRVYHPTLNSYQDVPAASVEEWKAAGWRLTAPDHFDPAIAPRLPVADEPVESPAKAAKK